MKIERITVQPLEAYRYRKGSPRPEWLDDIFMERSAGQATLRTALLQFVQYGDYVVKDEDGMIKVFNTFEYRSRFKEIEEEDNVDELQES